MTLAMVTDKEFLVAFSYADRDRAKLIRNYRWDPVEKVWRYPLTQRTYKELLREFDLDELEFAGNVSKLAEWDDRVRDDQGFYALIASLPDEEDDDLPGSEEYRFLCSLHEMVRDQGFDLSSNAELFGFLQECVLLKASNAGVDARSVIQNAQLAAAKAEIARLRVEKKLDGRSFEAALVDAVWVGDIPRPDFLQSFAFGSEGVIKATEWVARSLKEILRKAPTEAVSLYELVREAADAQIINKDVHRLCETLRHQRNKFGHDRVDPNETIQHTLLALTAFSLVYRELFPMLPPTGE